MRSFCFVLMIVCMFTGIFSVTINAQTNSSNNKNPDKHEISFTLKTDLLPIFNSAIDKRTTEFSASGEINLNRKYSLQLNSGFEKANNSDNSHSAFRLSAEFRSYIQNDQCSCSSLHLGGYFGINNETTMIDHRLNQNTYIKYRKSTFECGIAGGYRAVVYSHWIVDPVIHAGIATAYQQKTIESLNSISEKANPSLIVQIELQIGYRF